MINLAGKSDCDRFIERELRICGIPQVRVEVDTVHHEVPFTIIGKLGQFTFTRAWYYYVVEGKVPLAIAQSLYNDPAGKEDVRVAGHCGCPPPEKPWAKFFDKQTGKKLVDRAEYERCLEMFSNLGTDTEEYRTWIRDYQSSDDPTQGEGFVDLYHIDSEIGLRIFADAVRQIAQPGN